MSMSVMISLAAQSQQFKNSIEFDFGAIHSRLIDDGYSKNLLFYGTNSKFRLSYSRFTERLLFGFSAQANVGKVRSKSSNLPSDFYNVQPSIEFLVRAESLNAFFGLSLVSSNYVLINEPVFDNARLLSLHGAYGKIRKIVPCGEKQNIQFTYLLPVAVFVNHVLWNGGASKLTADDLDHLARTLVSNGSFVFFDVIHNITFGIEYTRKIGDRVSFVANYNFIYFRDATAPSFSIYSNELMAGLNILF